MPFDDKGIKKIREKLESAGQCVLLAQLGELLEEDERPATKLIDALRENGLDIKYGLKSTEVYACLPGQNIPTQKEGLSSSNNQLLQKYRRSLLLAFTKVTTPGEKIYFCFKPKMRFAVVKDGMRAPADGIMVEEKFRLSGVDLTVCSDAQTINKFEENLRLWVSEHGLEMDKLRWVANYQGKKDTDPLRLLRDLIAAQEPSLRSRILIPCSVILALLRND